MKKIILLLLLVLVSVTASARKSYINIYSANTNGISYNYSYCCSIYLTGDIPKGIADFEYHCEGTVKEYAHIKASLGYILNVLSELGYEVEFMSLSDSEINYVLSKEIPDGQTISKGDVNTDGEINIADVNEVISLILGYVREHPEILEQIKK